MAEAISTLPLGIFRVCVTTVPTFCVCLLDYDDISNQIDFIICLGGDGTLLYASSLFQVRLCFRVLYFGVQCEEVLSV